MQLELLWINCGFWFYWNDNIDRILLRLEACREPIDMELLTNTGGT